MSLLVAVDVGGTKMLGGVVTPQGTLLTTKRIPTRRASYLDDLSDLVESMLRAARERGEEVRGIGVGTTGLIDLSTGTMLRSIALDLPEIPIGPTLGERFGLPVRVDNDIHAAAMGELVFGMGREHDDFLLFNAGTGIAVGTVLGRRLHRGASNVAGEVGHVSIDPDGPRCPCGLPGCLEHLVVLARRGEPVPSYRFERVDRPPPSAAYAFLALGLINLVNLLNPAAIVLAGGMFTENRAAVDWVRDAVRGEALASARAGLRHLDLSGAGAAIGLIGAAALVLENETRHGREGVAP